ncbi:Thermonuclease family protein [hydrothermal vent metagenome]|uniref:Thermonuclease family protein n=1 Tax=hydrothermal vent metagenome TaxID=652676 RepID=A0A1W1CP85_9ZZZZ
MKILLLFLSFSVFAQLPEIKVPNEKALYIIDGDSVSLKMRIYGIDTPEKKQKCQEIKGVFVDCGILAKKALAYVFDKVHGEITITPIAFGHYGRMLVKIYRNGIDIGKSMVKAGVAFAYGSEYKVYEQEAQKEKAGFWGYYQTPQKPKLWRKKNKRKYNSKR